MLDDKEYASAFDAFLETTNEKTVLLAELQKIIQERNVRSLLDIGPGNGDLSIPLSRAVDHYLGVEPIEQYAQKLQKAGLHVINQPFPTEILEHFNMALACHVVSLDQTNIPEFLNAAWECIVPGGALVIVTHSGAESDWSRLTAALGKIDLPYHRAVFERVLQLLKERGEVELRTVTTTVESDSIERMLQALGFIWSDGVVSKLEEFLEKKSAISQILNRDYKASHYSFPFEHTFLITTKP